MRRRVIRRAVVLMALAVVGAFVAAGTAAAHTGLDDSEPDDGQILPTTPEVVVLTFVNDIDPALTSLELRSVDGTTVVGVARTTADSPRTKTVEFSLPPVADGVYGATWESVGSDGHRVSGEIVFGVGAESTATTDLVATTSFSTTDPADRLAEVSGAIGRGVWYAGASLVVGGLFVAAWTLTRGVGRPGAGRIRAGSAFWLRAGIVIAISGALTQAGTLVVILARGYGDGGLADGLSQGALSPNTRLWAATALVMGLLWFPIRSVISSTTWDRSIRWRLWACAAGLTAAAAFSTAAGHASAQDSPLTFTTIQTIHLLAAAAWIGPLAVITLVHPRIRRLAGESTPAMGALLRDYSRLALGSFALLVVTGVPAVWIMVGTQLTESGYGITLIIKLAVILGVVLPLGWYHDRQIRAARTSGADIEIRTIGSPGFLRTVRVEVLALFVVLGLAALLTGLAPSPSIDTSSTAVGPSASGPLDAEVVDDIAECADLEVGLRGCYRDYLRDLMETDGADVAVALVADLSITDAYVSAECHQITHDLGEDAVEVYDTLAEALSFEASACWSGYYHGIVETELSQLDDDQLREELPSICTSAAESGLYSFAHFNCVHGMGHGIMLRFDADLFTSLPYCDALPDPWEVASCLGGAFMENIITAQQGLDATLDENDLSYPCDDVQESYASDCWLMQTSYILWQNDYDWPATFAVCDGLETGLIPVCYQSMGRDASGNSLLSVTDVISTCDLGSESYRQFCYIGAALNAVFNDAGTTNADALCDAVEQRWREPCTAAVAQGESTL